MKELIDKSAVVAEIEKRIKKYASIDVGNNSELEALYGAKCHALRSVLAFLDTLEVKEWTEEDSLMKENNNLSKSDGGTTMAKEDKELLLKLILKLDEDGLLNIYDNDENHCELKYAFIDGEELCVKINR